MPLVYQAFNWTHGVYIGATVGSETTAAAEAAAGVVRRDPMAMLPFCGYNMGDYFRHWIEMRRQIRYLPRIFHVNWFRKGEDGSFLWPGFGDNLRVLRWIIDRCEGRVEATQTAIGYLPGKEDIDITGLNLEPSTMESLLNVDKENWRQEMQEIGDYLEEYGSRLPQELLKQQREVLNDLG